MSKKNKEVDQMTIEGTTETEILARLDASHPFRWSVGTATAVEGDTLSTMLSRADAALYEHKRRTRARD